MARKDEKSYVTVKHGRVTLLCKPVIGKKDAYRAVATFSDEVEVVAILQRIDEGEK